MKIIDRRCHVCNHSMSIELTWNKNHWVFSKRIGYFGVWSGYELWECASCFNVLGAKGILNPDIIWLMKYESKHEFHTVEEWDRIGYRKKDY